MSLYVILLHLNLFYKFDFNDLSFLDNWFWKNIYWCSLFVWIQLALVQFWFNLFKEHAIYCEINIYDLTFLFYDFNICITLVSSLKYYTDSLYSLNLLHTIILADLDQHSMWSIFITLCLLWWWPLPISFSGFWFFYWNKLSKWNQTLQKSYFWFWSKIVFHLEIQNGS